MLKVHAAVEVQLPACICSIILHYMAECGKSGNDSVYKVPSTYMFSLYRYNGKRYW